ncbi:MAG: RNA polymerase sigma factor [Proteobacteria bacterium]|nr:RNA polymerase sigma factor [Pseudomonadota bacterium]MBU4470712.1 RNA polymerase sigma factor [Pseudomonadota bacterium]MCG2751192.1 RNA polymerase sigma factor [Desulfobacteraceae bacterium]
MMTEIKPNGTIDPEKSRSPHGTDQVVLAREGNREAFNGLISLFHRDIFRMVYYRVRSQMDAEDLTQDVFTQAFKNISQLKEPEKFKSWLYSIAVNRVRDYYRKNKIRSWIGFFSENGERNPEDIQNLIAVQDDPLEDVLKKDFWNHLEMAMASLSKMEKDVFLLRFLDHLGLKEIAQTLSRSESTIKTHLYRALVKMQSSALLKKLYGKENV